MKDFKYCIWYLPIINHSWYKLTNGFLPHISIATNLNSNQAENLVKSIQNIKSKIHLSNSIQVSIEENFYAAYYNVTCDKQHIWWPKNAHISLLYQYKPFSNRQIESLNNIEVKDAIFDQIKIFKCSGHFLNWREI